MLCHCALIPLNFLLALLVPIRIVLHICQIYFCRYVSLAQLTVTSVVVVVHVGFKTKKSLVFSIQCSPFDSIHCCPSSIEMFCCPLTRHCFRSFALLLYVVHVIYVFCSCSDNAIGSLSLSLVFVRMFIELCVECMQWTTRESLFITDRD